MKKKLFITFGIIFTISLFLIIYSKDSSYNGEVFKLSDKYYNNGDYVVIDSSKLNKAINNNESFILYVHNNFCSFSVPCGDIFKEATSKYKIDVMEIMFDDYKNTKFYKKVKYAPSVLIVKDGKIIDYLDAEDDDDLNKYQDVDTFENWLKKYIILEK